MYFTSQLVRRREGFALRKTVAVSQTKVVHVCAVKELIQYDIGISEMNIYNK